MERFDILDKNGEPTGRTAGKGEPLQSGEYYLGTHAYIFNRDGMYLVGKRALYKSFAPGEYEVVLGHQTAGESSYETTVREVKEEVGLDMSIADIRSCYRLMWHDMNHIIDIYFVQLDFSLDDVTLQPEEVIGAELFTPRRMAEHVVVSSSRIPAYNDHVVAKIKELTPF